jgi:hypothetical protein
MNTPQDVAQTGYVSPHFKLSEVTFSATAIANHIDNTPTPEQLMNILEAADQLEAVRALLNAPMHIDSWIREAAVNEAVGGCAHSAHQDGWAIDFICPDFGTPQDIAKAIIAANIPFDQLIFEGTWIHISFNPTKRQQVLTAHFAHGCPTTYTCGI